jgi:hypothetical protein
VCHHISTGLYINHSLVILKSTKIGKVKPNQDPYLKNERKIGQPLSVQTLDTGNTPPDHLRFAADLNPRK